jgi:hypothetical protein
MLEIIGDSHIIALSEAVRHEPLSSRHGDIRIAQMGHGYNFLEPFFAIEDDTVSFTQPPAKAIFETINPNGPSVILRNDPRRFVFMFGLYPSFGFDQKHWTSHTAAIWSRDRHFVSKSAFDVIIDETLKEPMSFFRALHDMNVRFSVASCCPVPASYQRIAHKLNFADGEIAFIYNRFRDRATERLNAMGIVCHHPPQEAYDEHGAMHDVFAKQPGDYHANARYGRLMLEKVLRETDALG